MGAGLGRAWSRPVEVCFVSRSHEAEVKTSGGKTIGFEATWFEATVAKNTDCGPLWIDPSERLHSIIIESYDTARNRG